LILVTFDVLTFYDAIGKIRTSKVYFVGKTFDGLILPMASKKVRTLKVYFVGEHFQHSDITYGIKKDQNIKSLICVTFNILFDKVIFDVLIKISKF
jgi:hypothetical protein